MGMATASIVSDDSNITIQKAYFSTNPSLDHYLFVIGQNSDSEGFYGLFVFAEGTISRVQVDAPILRNLYRIISEVEEPPSKTDSLRVLYHAEQQYCTALFEQASDLREKEYYKMFLELISERLSNLPEESEKNILESPIEEMDLSVRSFNILRRANIYTIGDLVSMTEGGLMKVRNMGSVSMKEILHKLQELGLALKSE